MPLAEHNPGYLYRCKVTDAEGNVVYSEPGEVILLMETWSFTYNADGLRTNRTNGSSRYDYVYNGSSLSQMTVGDSTLSFAYDASGKPVSVKYNGTLYFYVTNLQGDVTAILNTSGATVVQYTYDAWGSILTTTGSLASTLGAHNPLRYRGYVYDTETQLYYLQSRYYNPAIGRFINADALVATGQGLLGNNMFAYCLNNPVVCADETGVAARVCISADGRITDSPWREHSPSSGGRPYKNYSSGSNYYGEVTDKFYTVKIIRATGNGIRIGAKFLWSAYVTWHNMQQETQLMEAQMMLDLFDTPETASKTLGVVGAELVFIGYFWAGQLLNPIGAGLLFVAAIVAFG